jgi:hypothetical protein
MRMVAVIIDNVSYKQQCGDSSNFKKIKDLTTKYYIKKDKG